MKENLYTKNHIRTVSGQYVNLLDPDPKTLLIDDIAHSLACTPRFGGHLPELYSVAQHSVLGSLIIKPSLAYDFLMHDISEAYLGDVPKPLKDNLPEYEKIEHNMMVVLSKKFFFQYPLVDEVKSIDRYMLEKEWSVLMLGNHLDGPIHITAPPNSKKSFLNRFYELFKEHLK